MSYGATFKLTLVKDQYVQFRSGRSLTILWKYDDSGPPVDPRMKMVGKYFMIHNVTQADTGWYIVKDKKDVEMYRKNLVVTGEDPSWSLNLYGNFGFVCLQLSNPVLGLMVLSCFSQILARNIQKKYNVM